ncbi:hypothetical protein Pan216_23370 [Planctomycetes bacterium Pan216]|uniref:Uncharacterized protein n=1 Tax=Kolteria novifilia TaxID=2527975 RepID=A0A518B3C9_9BACT|nr:hypothetical protein Pan216_23370 [Planctomycetes bacterium Pan216]
MKQLTKRGGVKDSGRASYSSGWGLRWQVFSTRRPHLADTKVVVRLRLLVRYSSTLPLGEVGERSETGEGKQRHGKQSDLAKRSPLTPNPSPTGRGEQLVRSPTGRGEQLARSPTGRGEQEARSPTGRGEQEARSPTGRGEQEARSPTGRGEQEARSPTGRGEQEARSPTGRGEQEARSPTGRGERRRGTRGSLSHGERGT